MDIEAVFAEVRAAISSTGGRVTLGEDDFGNPKVFVSRTMYHLDADALNDRLQAWITREVNPQIRGASAFVSFRNARPASQDDAEMDHEEEWHGLEPTLRLEASIPPPTEGEVASFVALIPQFLHLVDRATGRPADYRDPEMGNSE